MPDSDMADVCCCQQQALQASNKSSFNMKINIMSRKRTNKNASEMPLKGLDQNNNQHSVGECNLKCRLSVEHSGLMFKYQANASRREIAELRELLRQERELQFSSKHMSAEEIAFYASDYERMMIDDWLVTRFLLRGKKAFERDACENELAKTNDGELELPTSRRAVLEHTLDLIKVCAKFRFDYQINAKTKLAEFPYEWTKVEGLFHYKPDLVGNPTAYLRVALHRPKLIEAPEARHQFKRYMLYTLERCDCELFNRPGKAICCIFDMTNVAFENIDLELTTWMIKSFKSCSPKLLCYVIVYNPPWFFTATFKVICNTLLSTSKRQSVKFAYGDEILNYISYANLPSYIKSTIH